MTDVALRWIHLSEPWLHGTHQALGVHIHVADLLAAMDECDPDVLRGHLERLLDERVEVAEASEHGHRG